MFDKELFVTKPYLPPRELFNQCIDEIWENYHLTNHGPLHNRLQTELSRFFDGNRVTLTANGHLGLDVALHVLGIKGEVITTPFSFASTTHALTWKGITPVFCDVRENDLTIDPDKIEELITESTTAILPIHVYGHICDVGRIGEIARKHNLKIIYDAAHAFGVRLNGKSISAYGDVSMFSFHATKLFHTGEGGALVYPNDDMQSAFDAAINFGIINGNNDYIGMNAKMSELHAAMGLCILPKISGLIEERKILAKRYQDQLADIPGITSLVEFDNPGVEHNYAYMPILIDAEKFGYSREELFEVLEKRQINCRKYFYPLISDYACYKGRFSYTQTPVAHRAAEQALCLPFFNGMELEDVDRVCNTILCWVQSPYA